MNPLIEKELKKLKDIYFYDIEGNIILEDELSNNKELVLKSTDSLLYNKKEVKFTFKDYLIQPFSNNDFHIKYNRGKIIPLKVMQGYILKRSGNLYYIKTYGLFFKNNQCIHCLKEKTSNPICLDCYKKLNITDIEEITWEGYIPIKDCQIEEI